MMQVQIEDLIAELRTSEEKYYAAVQAVDSHKER